MIQVIAGQRCYVACCSSGRPGNVPEVEARFAPLTWHVPEGQWGDYRAAGATRLAPGVGDNVSAAYNLALRAAWAQDAWSVRTDDDVRGQSVLADCRGGHEKITTRQAVEVLVSRLAARPDIALAGVSQVGNPFYVKAPVSTRLHMSSCLHVARPCEVVFDESIRIFTDVDYNLQHLIRFGGYARCNDVIVHYRLYIPGGVQEYREKPSPDGKYQDPTDRVVLADAERLSAKWGALIKFKGGNPVRPYFQIAR